MGAMVSSAAAKGLWPKLSSWWAAHEDATAATKPAARRASARRAV